MKIHERPAASTHRAHPLLHSPQSYQETESSLNIPHCRGELGTSLIRPKSFIFWAHNPSSFLLPSSARINRQLRHCSPHNPIVACLLFPSAAAAGGVPRLMLLLLLRRLSVRLALLLRDGAGDGASCTFNLFTRKKAILLFFPSV